MSRGVHGVRAADPRFSSAGERIQLGDEVFAPWGKSTVRARVTAWADDGRLWATFTNRSGKQMVRRVEPRACVIVGQGALFDVGGVR